MRRCTSTAASATRSSTPEPFTGKKRGQAADLRRPAARRAAPPLRLPARARRRARELGGAEGRPARARPARARRPRRGPPARLRDVRGRDPEGPVRRRHRRDLGHGHLRARRGEEGRRPDRPPARQAARGTLDARAGEARRRPEELAAPPEARRGRARAAQAQAATQPMLATLAERRAARATAGCSRSSGTATARSRTSRGGEATLVSRNGNDLTGAVPGRREGAAAKALKTPDCVLDGEVCALDEQGRPSFSAMQQGKPGTPIVYVRLRRARGRRRAARRPAARASGASGWRSCSTGGTARSASRRRSTTARRCSTPPRSRVSRASSPSGPTRATGRASARATG